MLRTVFSPLFLLFLVFSTASISTQGQTRASDVINWQEIDYDFAEELLIAKVNELRNRKRRQALEEHDQLKQAADKHNRWQSKAGKISHRQPKSKTSTPFKRVRLISEDWIQVGENLLRLDYVFSEAENGDLYRELTYDEMTDKMLSLWRKSKGHYKNLIRKEYENCGTAIYFDARRRTVYVTQVYGRR